MQEHLHTRASASLFDVSHMGQICVSGAPIDELANALEAIFPADLQALKANSQCYSVLLNAQGGVLDDLMICKRENDFLLVVNAGCKYDDLKTIQSLLPENIKCELLDKALLALQGPKAAGVLQSLGANVDALTFMQAANMSINGVECFVTRGGYTGEDGFEISLENYQACAMASTLLENTGVKPAGLGARDSLRLEAGLCLYGHELNPNTTPKQAGIVFAIAKARRMGGEREGGFVGSDTVLKELDQGAKTKRIGLIAQGKAPVRNGAVLLDEQQNEIGVVTSGGFSPSLQKPIALATVQSDFSGQQVFAQVRKKSLPMNVTKLPFVANNYKR